MELQQTNPAMTYTSGSVSLSWEAIMRTSAEQCLTGVRAFKAGRVLRGSERGRERETKYIVRRGAGRTGRTGQATRPTRPALAIDLPHIESTATLGRFVLFVLFFFFLFFSFSPFLYIERKFDRISEEKERERQKGQFSSGAPSEAWTIFRP